MYTYDQAQVADEEYYWCLAPGIGFVKKTGTGWGISIRVKKVIINGVETDY